MKEKELEILKKLDKLAKSLAENKDDMPNIAQCSIAIEHKKIDLIKIFSDIDDGEQKYLALLNLILLTELNFCNGVLQVLEDGKDVDDVCESLKKAGKSALACFKKLCENCE